MIDLQDFIREHERALTGFALQLTRSEDDADDLLQDTWIKALTHQSLLENLSVQKQRSWLFTVLKNRWLDICRRRKLEQLHNAQLPLPVSAPFSSHQLDAHLDKLPALEREIVQQRFWMGNNSREIASELGIPEGTVRWRLKLALDKLRKSITQSEKEERCLL